MEKKECIIPYYKGNLEWTVFLLNIIYDLESNGNILLKENINAAKMGCISNVLLAIKETIVEEQPNYDFKSKILLSELEKAVSCIAKETPNGYMINKTLFKDPASLVAELRNKIAHGNYKLDLSHSRVIIKKDDEDVIININNLQNFIVMALKNYRIKITDKQYERDIIVSEKIERNRKEPIKSIDELISVIKDFSKITFTLKSKNDSLVNPVIEQKMQSVIRRYKLFQDNKVLYEFKEEIKDEYSFTWEISKIKKYEEQKELANQIINILPEDTNYDSQIKLIGYQIQRYMGIEYENLGPVFSNLKSLILLNELYTKNTINLNELFREIGVLYPDLSIDYDMASSSLMAMFNSLFSYANDDIYQKEDFDYSKLDLSLLNVETLKIDTLDLDQKNTQINTNTKEYNEVLRLIEETKDNISRIDSSNTKALTILNEKLNRLNTKEVLVKNILSNLEIEKQEILDNYDANKDKIRNSFIIERIRNSIAHGNYYVKVNDSYENAEIDFYDIYKGEEKFKAKIKLLDFISLINNNVSVIDEFINKEEAKTR